jgi:hypothetical protein
MRKKIVFDRNKEKIDKHFIAVNAIDVYAPIKSNSPKK